MFYCVVEERRLTHKDVVKEPARKASHEAKSCVKSDTRPVHVVSLTIQPSGVADETYPQPVVANA